MNKIRVFVRATGYTPIDDLAFVGDPPIKSLLPTTDHEVDVSVVWTWDITEGLRLAKEWNKYYKNVKIGGPAFNHNGGSFVPGQYVRKEITFTSRGCNRKCPWCYTQKREGKLRELQISDGSVIEDSNLLMCSKEHIISVFEMLRRNCKKTFFNGGFDARLFQKWHVDLLESIEVGEIYFACDHKRVLHHLKKCAVLLKNKPKSWKLCYVLLGFNETLEQAKERILEVKYLGFTPIPMLYQNNEFHHFNQEWKELEKEFLFNTEYMQLVNIWQKERESVRRPLNPKEVIKV